MTIARRRAHGVTISCVAILAALATSDDARAAGLYFSDRGVRPMGRAGAFVAGADDLGAIWYNPAGLADAGDSVLADFSWLHFSSDYARTLQIVDADNTIRNVTSPNVHGTSPVLPLPTIAVSHVFGPHKEFTIAGGIFAPYVALATYPSTVNGQPSPARYALGSFDGSALIDTGVWFAYKPEEWLRLGFGLQALVGFYQSTITFSVAPADRLVAAPEDPQYDAASSIRVGPIFAPSASGGVTLVPSKYLRIGLSGQLPTIISSHATINVRLPTGVVFDNAQVLGDDAHVRFALPAIARAGVELRPTDDLRLEVAYVHEFWSIEKSLDATPESMYITGIVGLPPRVQLPPISFPRNFQDSNSIRFGGEYSFALSGYPIDLRAGVSYESSAVPAAYESLFTIDMDKYTMSLGGSIHVGKRWRFDALYAHLFANSVTVNPADAKIGRVNPIQGNAPFEGVNGGTYSATADLLGVGVVYKY